MGRTLRKDDPDASAWDDAHHDAGRLVARMYARRQTITLEYDLAGRIVEKNFDNARNLRGIKYPDNDVVGNVGATGTDLGYDRPGRLSIISRILTIVTSRRAVVRANSNGATTTKTFDANSFWLTDTDTAAPGGLASNGPINPSGVELDTLIGVQKPSEEDDKLSPVHGQKTVRPRAVAAATDGGVDE